MKNFSFSASRANDSQDREGITFCSFQFVDLTPPKCSLAARQRHLFLLFAYTNGFQIFNVSDPMQVHEVASVREESPVRMCKMMVVPPEDGASEEGNVLKDKHPIVAIVMRDEKPNSSLIKFYSLRLQKYVHMLKLNSDVFAIASHIHCFVAAAKNQIFVFNPYTLEKPGHFQCFPNNLLLEIEPNQDALSFPILALGPRWLAFPSNQIIPNQQLDFTNLPNQSLAEYSMQVAKRAASGLYYLGDMGVKKVVNLLSSETPVENKISYSQIPHAGTVEIRDVETKNIVAHFRPHKEPITTLAWDPSGTLLATASVEGTVVNIFQIMPTHGRVLSNGKGIRYLYRLYRGITSAAIQSLEFSVNSKWIAVTSCHGTTHIYAINPNGGPVTPSTHCPQDVMESSMGNQASKAQVVDRQSVDVEPITLSAITRIHNSQPQAPENTKLSIGVTFYSPFQQTNARRTFHSERLLISNSKGFMYYRAEPFESKIEQDVMDMKLQILADHEICRSKLDPITTFPPIELVYPSLPPPPLQQQVEHDLKTLWISNVEINAYEPPRTQLWMMGQFKFKTFETQPDSQQGKKFHPQVFPDPTKWENKVQPINNLAKSVMIQVYEPIPLHPGHMKHVRPSAPPFPPGEIAKAIDTPMYSNNRSNKQGDMDNYDEWQLINDEESVPHVQSIDIASPQKLQNDHDFSEKSSNKEKFLSKSFHTTNENYFVDLAPITSSPARQSSPTPEDSNLLGSELILPAAKPVAENTRMSKSLLSVNENFFEDGPISQSKEK